MAKSSPISYLLIALGGGAIGFLAAQAITPGDSPESAPTSESSDEGAEPTALEGLERATLGERLRGEVTSESELNGNDGSRFERYMITLDEDDLVEVSLDGALQGVVALYDDQLQLLSASETLRQRIDQSGDYMLVVSGADAQSYGPFALESRRIELSDTHTLTLDSPLDSWLQSDEREYTFTVEEAGMYDIDMRSDEFDAYLVLEGPDGYYREDDDSAGNLDARIADFLAPGEYQLTARSAYGEGEGVFTLALTPRELSSDIELRNAGVLTPDEPLNGWYSGEELTYELTLEETSNVTLEMRSTDFDTYLDVNGNGVSLSDDDSAGGTDARIAEQLLPGTYTVTARGFSNTASGLFELTARTEPSEGEPEL
ncbi:hypothetical protein [Halomonas sp. HL-93]|uniref:hypothetical protein n=1 Tax=Halomonas sp. HL-93 TaxID=1666906 RepID=UPI0006DB8071|nr:hypothetical protein [Halomonas sp. HL-93]KPQ28665.1 MAG: Bacterial pre-peptidase C-terminal domain [Halomonas sp. HL-93]SBR46953.1 hypothetical protein GA0071314_0971 [Halomonas sp. HL-93]